MFYRVGDWDDLQIDLHVSFHVGLKIQFAGIVPVILEFNDNDQDEQVTRKDKQQYPTPEIQLNMKKQKQNPNDKFLIDMVRSVPTGKYPLSRFFFLHRPRFWGADPMERASSANRAGSVNLTDIFCAIIWENNLG